MNEVGLHFFERVIFPISIVAAECNCDSIKSAQNPMFAFGTSRLLKVIGDTCCGLILITSLESVGGGHGESQEALSRRAAD